MNCRYYKTLYSPERVTEISNDPPPVPTEEKYTCFVRLETQDGVLVCGNEKAPESLNFKGITKGLYFIYIRDGKGICNGYPVKKGDLIFFQPGDYREMTADPVHPWTNYWCVWKGNTVEYAQKHLSKYQSNRCYHVKDGFDPENLFRYMIYQSHRDVALERLARHFTGMLLADCRTEDPESAGTSSRRNLQLAEDIRAFIKAHLSDITVEEIASEFHFNKRYLTGLYRKITGFGLQEEITSARINYAQTLLLSGNKSMEEIAIDSGYMGYSSFIKAFKKTNGMTPSQYVTEIRDERYGKEE